jgi:hypothetical protein
LVVTGAGTKPAYSVVTRSGDHVAGWVMAFPAGTTLASAERLLSLQLPPDVQQTSSSRQTARSGGGACEVVDYQSFQLAVAFTGSPEMSNGKFSVSFFQVQPNGSIATSYVQVNRAIVAIPVPVPQPTCQ